jgi:hypothetical protein
MVQFVSDVFNLLKANPFATAMIFVILVASLTALADLTLKENRDGR